MGAMGLFPWSPKDEKRAPGWLSYIGDDKLPRYVGIIINHEYSKVVSN